MTNPAKPTTGFFISQIGEKGTPERMRADEVYGLMVKPVCEELGIEIGRADLETAPGPVTQKMVRSLLEADIVIADLTGRNPNVNYELGIAHSFGRRVVVLVDSAKSLPFDTKDERAIEIGGDSGGKIGLS